MITLRTFVSIASGFSRKIRQDAVKWNGVSADKAFLAGYDAVKNGWIVNNVNAPIEVTDNGKAFIHNGCMAYPMEILLSDLLS
jgi:hypothetical protein